MLPAIHWESPSRRRSISARRDPLSLRSETLTVVPLAARFTTASVLDQGSIEVVIGRRNWLASSDIAGMMPGSPFAFRIWEANAAIRAVDRNRTKPSNDVSRRYPKAKETTSFKLMIPRAGIRTAPWAARRPELSYRRIATSAGNESILLMARLV